jgi:hypothetical protein
VAVKRWAGAVGNALGSNPLNWSRMLPPTSGSNWRWADGAGITALPFPTRVIEIGTAMTTKYPVDPSAWFRDVAA